MGAATATALEPEGEPSQHDAEPALEAAGPTFAGPFDATMRQKQTNNVDMVLAGYQAHADTLVDKGPSTAPRKHYAGTYANGRFEKTKAATLNDLSEEERQAVLADLQADRERRAKELKRKKIEQSMKKQTDGKKAKAKRLGNVRSEGQVGQFAEEFGAQNAQQDRLKKAQAMQRALAKAKAQEELVDFFEQSQAAYRDRRLNIAEKRKGQLQQQSAMKGGYQPTVTQEAFPNSGVLHRHIHHHMHYHSEGDDTTAAPAPGRGVDHLPQLVNADGFRGGMHPGIRRHQSEVVVGTAGPSPIGYTALVHSPSAGQVLPTIAGRPPLGRSGGGGFHDAGGAPRMRATASTGMGPPRM